jgi:hypothetical protein
MARRRSARGRKSEGLPRGTERNSGAVERLYSCIATSLELDGEPDLPGHPGAILFVLGELLSLERLV